VGLDSAVLDGLKSEYDFSLCGPEATMRDFRIAIIGAGVGGLTLAIALRQRGVRPDVYEQAAELTEIGAAVALTANSTRELRRLGVLNDIAAASTEPEELIYRDGRTGRRIAAYPIHQEGRYQERFGAPFCGIHRAELQRILSAAHGTDGLHLGHLLVDIAEHRDGLRLRFANGHAADADIVVGADGVRSFVRRWVTGRDGVRYSGTSAFRGIVPQHLLPRLPDRMAIQFWMGPDAHLLHYALGGDGGHVNFFAVTEGPAEWPDPLHWVIDAAAGEALAPYAGWHQAVTEMVAAGWVTKRWGLFVVHQPQCWNRSRVVLLGDAVHTMLPHHGQGANTSIEDAVTLAELLPGVTAATWDQRITRYNALRRVRTRTIQRSSWATNRLLHLPDGPGLADRDARVARFPERFGWIHEHDALRAITHTG
jgi:salicylate hydroxylase